MMQHPCVLLLGSTTFGRTNDNTDEYFQVLIIILPMLQHIMVLYQADQYGRARLLIEKRQGQYEHRLLLHKTCVVKGSDGNQFDKLD